MIGSKMIEIKMKNAMMASDESGNIESDNIYQFYEDTFNNKKQIVETEYIIIEYDLNDNETEKQVTLDELFDYLVIAMRKDYFIHLKTNIKSKSQFIARGSNISHIISNFK